MRARIGWLRHECFRPVFGSVQSPEGNVSWNASFWPVGGTSKAKGCSRVHWSRCWGAMRAYAPAMSPLLRESENWLKASSMSALDTSSASGASVVVVAGASVVVVESAGTASSSNRGPSCSVATYVPPHAAAISDTRMTSGNRRFTGRLRIEGFSSFSAPGQPDLIASIDRQENTHTSPLGLGHGREGARAQQGAQAA